MKDYLWVLSMSIQMGATLHITLSSPCFLLIASFRRRQWWCLPTRKVRRREARRSAVECYVSETIWDNSLQPVPIRWLHTVSSYQTYCTRWSIRQARGMWNSAFPTQRQRGWRGRRRTSSTCSGISIILHILSLNFPHEELFMNLISRTPLCVKQSQ